MTYDAYGNARHHWVGDLTGDGAVGVDDQTAMRYARSSLGDANYNVDADVTRTGTIDINDAAITATGNFKAALPQGTLSAHGNTIGYAGYVFNPEVQLYTVRFRHYDPGLGRWLERDPLGYVDGMNLYEYVQSNAVNAFDPFGLCSSGPSSSETGITNEEVQMLQFVRNQLKTLLDTLGDDIVVQTITVTLDTETRITTVRIVIVSGGHN